jgi:hypothetical protein
MVVIADNTRTIPLSSNIGTEAVRYISFFQLWLFFSLFDSELSSGEVPVKPTFKFEFYMPAIWTNIFALRFDASKNCLFNVKIAIYEYGTKIDFKKL